MIRLATSEDVAEILDMGIVFWRLSPYAATMAENPQKMRELVNRLIDSETGDILVGDDRTGALTGMIGLMAYDHFLSGDRTVAEVFYWTNENARGTGLRLFKAAEVWAKCQGARLMQIGSPNERVDRLYARLGYAPVERTFHRVLA